MPTVFGTPTVGPATDANRLVNRTTLAVYTWPRNHSSEDPVRGLGRLMTRGGQSSHVRLMRHAQHPGPVILALHGNMIDVTPPTEHDKFVTFFNDCDDTTFDYISWQGDSYQVLITQHDARRQIERPDGSYFQFELDLVVLSINGSPLSDFFA